MSTCRIATFVLVLFVFNALGGEVWITPTGTGGGTGTITDPIQTPTGSSFTNTIATNPPNTVIHLMPGTFHSAGIVQVKAGWKIRGAGIDITTVQMDDLGTGAPSNWGTPLFGEIPPSVPEHPYERTDGVEVSDLTLDCNQQAQSGSTCIFGVGLSGSENKISRVKAINWGSTSGNECYVLRIFGDTGSILTNCVIEECVIQQPASITNTQGATALSILGSTDGSSTIGNGWIVGAEIKNCFISGIVSGSPGTPNYFNGTCLMGISGGKVAGNKVINISGASTAFFNSCESALHYTIENNLFLDVSAGIWFSLSDACGLSSFAKEDIQIHDNVITVKNGGGAIQVSGYGQNMHNVVVKDNYVQALGTSPSSGFNFYNADTITFEDNTIDYNGAIEMNYDSTASFASIRNNKNTSGNEINQPGTIPDAEDQCIIFQPTSTGWYRLLQSYTQSYSSSNVRITRDPSWTDDNTVIDLEFNYWVMGSLTDPDVIGDINLTQLLAYNPGGINKIRVGNVGGGTGVYLDIYVATDPTNTPISIKTRGGKQHWFLPTPLYVGTTNMPAPCRVLNIDVAAGRGSGFRTTGRFVAGTNNIVLTDSSGYILNSALNSNLATIAGLSTSAGNLVMGNGTSWTSATVSGDATISSGGVLSVNHISAVDASLLSNVSGGAMVSSGGNIGVGTASPATKLDVNGTIQATGLKLTSGASNGYVLMSDAAGLASWQPYAKNMPFVVSATNIDLKSVANTSVLTVPTNTVFFVTQLDIETANRVGSISPAATVSLGSSTNPTNIIGNTLLNTLATNNTYEAVSLNIPTILRVLTNGETLVFRVNSAAGTATTDRANVHVTGFYR
jgi:hypothetical protein